MRFATDATKPHLDRGSQEEGKECTELLESAFLIY